MNSKPTNGSETDGLELGWELQRAMEPLSLVERAEFLQYLTHHPEERNREGARQYRVLVARLTSYAPSPSPTVVAFRRR